MLAALASHAGKPELAEDLIEAKRELIEAAGNSPPDDIKRVAGKLYLECKSRLDLENAGSDAKAFMRDTLAPMVRPEMATHQELKKDIFTDHQSLA